jgi:hypothetical protein
LITLWIFHFQSFRKRNGGEIHQVCAACGHPGTINMASHKLTTYIAKNPPDAVRSSSSTSFITDFSHHRKQKLNHQQIQKLKANQKARRIVQVVLIKIQMNAVLTKTMEKL